MLVFNKKTKIYNFLTKIKKTWGGGFGVGAGGDENLIIDFYWPYSFCVTFQFFTDRSIHILPEICMMELMQKKKLMVYQHLSLAIFYHHTVMHVF